MSGIDWKTAGKGKFDKIVEILLRREFGLRGHAVNGRGGDEGIDYDVDDSKMIFQFKFFPEGFSSSHPSRRRQITKSFKAAMAHDPDEWILVVPATLTPPERRFVTGLGKGKRVRISIRDETWLDDQLMTPANKDLLDHYLYGSDVDYLYARAQAFQNNPVVRDADDLTARVHALREDADIVDPNWRLDFASVDGEIVHTLVPKDPGAPERAPVGVDVTVDLPEGSPERRALEEAEAYGYTSEIRLVGDMIRDYQIHGTRLLSNRKPDELRVGPVRGEANEQPGELIVAGPSGERLGVFLVKVTPMAHGKKGGVLEVVLGDILTLTLTIPFEPADQDEFNVKYSFHSATGLPVTEMFEVADFIVKLGAADTCEVRIQGNHIITMDAAGRSPAELVEEFRQFRLLADDLRVIEAAANTRFRWPDSCDVEDRLEIRNLRLMLEGHCVAHPTAVSITVRLNGERDESLDQFLNADPKWMKFTTEPGTFEILGQRIVLPELAFVGLLHLTPDEVAAADKAFENGNAEDHPVVLRTRPRDRMRVYLPDRRDPNLPVDITPWGIEGIIQKGLGLNGEPLAGTDTTPPLASSS